MNDSHEAVEEEYDPMAALVGPLMKTVLGDVARERQRQDGDMGIFRDYACGTAGRMHHGPTIGRDRERARETYRALQEAERIGKTTWRHLLEDSVACLMTTDSENETRATLLSVAAHAVAWIEAIDRRKDEKRIAKKMRAPWWKRALKAMRLLSVLLLACGQNDPAVLSTPVLGGDCYADEEFHGSKCGLVCRCGGGECRWQDSVVIFFQSKGVPCSE